MARIGSETSAEGPGLKPATTPIDWQSDALATAGIVPIPFAPAPDDACTGNRHGICVTCQRLYARGKHITPAARRSADGISECLNRIELVSTHAASVTAALRVAQDVCLGGVDTAPPPE